MSEPAATAFVAFGSNLGDREEHIASALRLLAETESIALQRTSSLVESEPVGGPEGQGPYLNGVAHITTSLPPLELLRSVLAIEDRLGRVRTERFGPRTIDLDLLLYEDHVLDEAGLTLPHPRLHERLFVLGPLAEIAPGAVHPKENKTVAELLSELTGQHPFGTSTSRELAGTSAVVTGSTSGIGRAIVLELARAGANVVVHGYRSQERADSVVHECRLQRVEARSILADLSDPDRCRQLVSEAWQMCDGVDIWVNNAGADVLTGEAASGSFEQKLETLWEVDVRSTIDIARSVGRRMKETGQGVLFTMGWDQAERGMEGDSGEMFATIKGAIMAFSRSLALSLAPEVRVHCLAPGWIRTSWGEEASSTWQQRVLDETPLRRWGTPEDVASTVRYLASPQARYLTGQVVRINGGAVR